MSFTVKIKLLIAFCFLAAGVYSHITITNLREENAILQNNHDILLISNSEAQTALQSYRVQDSLNAVKIGALLLTIDDYEHYRSSDAALIKKLQTDKNGLQRIISTQAETINKFEAALQDTAIAIDSALVAAQVFNYQSTWTDVSGIIAKDSIILSIVNRESLQIVETVKYKRFLGFLWKTNRIKSRDLDIVSKNPNTSILNVDYIHIVK